VHAAQEIEVHEQIEDLPSSGKVQAVDSAEDWLYLNLGKSKTQLVHEMQNLRLVVSCYNHAEKLLASGEQDLDEWKEVGQGVRLIGCSVHAGTPAGLEVGNTKLKAEMHVAVREIEAAEEDSRKLVDEDADAEAALEHPEDTRLAPEAFLVYCF